MESNIFRASSLGANSSSRWRTDTSEDDEEALKWAAIEKLPTFRRMKKGILDVDGVPKEIDINSLGLQEKKILLDRLVRVAEEDNEKFLFKLKERIDRVRIDIPTIEVRFEHLNVDAEAYVGGRALPTVFNFSVNMIEGFLNYIHVLPSRKKPISILQNVSGIIKPRR